GRGTADYQPARLRRNRPRLGACVAAGPKLDLRARPARDEVLGEALAAVLHQGRGGGHDPARAAMVAAQRDRRRPRKARPEPLEARARRTAETVDALVVVPHDPRPAPLRA